MFSYRKAITSTLAATFFAGLAAAKTDVPPLSGDAAIVQKVIHEVRMYTRYSMWDDVKISVENGTVHLLGEVTQPYKKSNLGSAIASIPGVNALDNELKVAPLSSFDDQLRMQVARAIYQDSVLWRYGLDPLPSIHIIVDHGHVTLEGVVRTSAEKQVAGMRANAGLSLGMATNNLTVEAPSPTHN